jgi:plastocyanin
MQPRSFRWIIVAIALCAMATRAQAATIRITMENLVISPAEASAKVGDTVEWVNKDVLAHTATANKTGSFVLKKAGNIDYYCRFHPNMKAVLKIDQ